jgi:Predicted nucleotidyltransferases
MYDMPVNIQIDIDQTKIAAFCSRWKVTELALFGSVLGAEFRPDSDVDVLVTFAPGAGWSLFDLVGMAAELEGMFGRHVDLVEPAGLRNPFRRHSILKSKQVIHAA